MYAERKALLADWQRARDAIALLYVTGDRQNWETMVHAEVLDRFVHHLDAIGQVKKITLILYTRGGNTLAAWSIVNLIRQFCDHLEVVVPSKAHSAGTLICLGADLIMMTKQATLGPIDPSVNGPLNPDIPGAPAQARFPVSVEAINGYLDFAKSGASLTEAADLKDIFLRLSERVHPLVLGDAYRSRSQIRMLAKRLVARQLSDEKKIERVLDFLCSESGSHDYTIYRQEARDSLGLNVERPTDDLYTKLKGIYDDFAGELKLAEAYSHDVAMSGKPTANYDIRRALIESSQGGSHYFCSQGTLTKQQIQTSPNTMQIAIEDRRTFDGWKFQDI